MVKDGRLISEFDGMICDSGNDSDTDSDSDRDPGPDHVENDV